MPTIGSLELNFDILETNDCKNLSIIDLSHYLETPESPIVDITLPGYSSPIRFQFKPNQINVFNSYSFNLSVSNTAPCLEAIPDGLYEITYAICPSDCLRLTKYHLQTCKLRCRFYTLWAKATTTCDLDSKLIRELDRIEVLFRGAEANAKICNTIKATDLYKKANEMLSRLENGCDCGNS